MLAKPVATFEKGFFTPIQGVGDDSICFIEQRCSWLCAL